MKSEEKLWPRKGEQVFKEIRPYDLVLLYIQAWPRYHQEKDSGKRLKQN